MNIWKEITTLMNPIFMSISEILCFIDTYMLSSFHSGVWTVATGGHRDGAHEEGQSLFRTIVTAWGRCHCTHHLLTAHEKKEKKRKSFYYFLSSALAVSCLHFYEFACTRQHWSCVCTLMSQHKLKFLEWEICWPCLVHLSRGEIHMNLWHLYC